MTTVAIPAWNPQGLLPPIDVLNPTSVERSPYRVVLTDVVRQLVHEGIWRGATLLAPNGGS